MAQRDGIRLTSHFARGTFPDVACLQRSARGKERSRPLVRSEGKRVGKKSRLDRSVKWTSPLEGLGRTATSLAGCSHRAAPPLRAAAAAPPPGVRENEPSNTKTFFFFASLFSWNTRTRRNFSYSLTGTNKTKTKIGCGLPPNIGGREEKAAE